MSRSTLAIVLIYFLPTVVLAKHLQPVLGGGITTDSPLAVGTVNSLLTTVYAGDVVVCDFGVNCNGSTPKSDWSYVLVFYSSIKGPEFTDASKDANSAYIFSENSDLTTFFTRYDNGRRGDKGLSSDVVFLNEDASGDVKVANYEFGSWGDPIGPKGNLSSYDAVVPEPSTVVFLGMLLIGLACRKHYGTVRRLHN